MVVVSQMVEAGSSLLFVNGTVVMHRIGERGVYAVNSLMMAVCCVLSLVLSSDWLAHVYLQWAKKGRRRGDYSSMVNYELCVARKLIPDAHQYEQAEWPVQLDCSDADVRLFSLGHPLAGIDYPQMAQPMLHAYDKRIIWQHGCDQARKRGLPFSAQVYLPYIDHTLLQYSIPRGVIAESVYKFPPRSAINPVET